MEGKKVQSSNEVLKIWKSGCKLDMHLHVHNDRTLDAVKNRLTFFIEKVVKR